MKTAEYLDRLLLKYSNDFNIYKPFRIGAREYPAYGYFFSHNERYVLIRDVNMWSSDSYEHILFMEAEQITENDVNEAHELITGYMENELVRKGEKYPAENHMLSLLTVVLLSDKPLAAESIKIIKKFKFDKGYRMNMRGFSRGRIIAASMEDQGITASPQAKDMKKVFKSVFKEVEEGRPGFTEVCETQGVTPFQQET